MAMDSGPDAAARERLSALMDGELDSAAVAQACVHWRESAEIRSSWSGYHLIGDAMRSDDLAVDPGGDASFLAAFRARLQVEPVILAPQPLESSAPVAQRLNAARGARRSWAAPSAVAAGFVAVAGVVLALRAPGPSLEPTATASIAARPTVLAGEAQAMVVNGQLLRDARLDRYLAAHKQFAGSSALGVPSGFLRNATASETDR